MPKITAHGGPTYAGLVDASPQDEAVPEWVAPEPDPADPAEPAAAPAVPARRRRTRARKES